MEIDNVTITEVHLAAIMLAVAGAALLSGGGFFEQAVLDPLSPPPPSLVRPSEGGANRKRFWIPAHAAAGISFAVGLWGAWPSPSSRLAALIAVGIYLVITFFTVTYFAPAVIRLEKATSIDANA